MAVINRVRLTWTGFPGQPGVSTLYFTDGTVPGGSLRTFLSDCASSLVNGVTISFPIAGDKIESTTGDIVGAWTAGPTTAVVGTATVASYAAPTGICVDWLTGSVVNGRRPMGRTFLVPAAPTAYQNNGSISDSVVATIQNAANTFVTAMGQNFLVWTRPFPGSPEQPGPPVIPAKPARLGAASAVVGARVPDKAVVLRSRRD